MKDAAGNWVLYNSGNHRYTNNTILGNVLPDFTGGITSTLVYKNWDFAVGIDFQEGGLYHSVTDMFSMAAGLHEWTAGLNDKGNPKRDAVIQPLEQILDKEPKYNPFTWKEYIQGRVDDNYSDLGEEDIQISRFRAS